MKYKDIASKYEVSENTVKSWRKRYGWQRNCTTKKRCNKQEVQEQELQLKESIRADLVSQIKDRDFDLDVYKDLIEDYLRLWDIKNRLFKDIKVRGVTVIYENGKQTGQKRNDSISEVVKVNNQMLKILSELSLKPSPLIEDDDDDF